MKNITCIEELRTLARRRVPRIHFGYTEAGSYTEETLRANRADLERLKLRQRVLVDISKRDLSTTILGEPVSLPIGLAPVGMTGLIWGDGEILACRAAQQANVPYTLSTLSICSIEDVAAATSKPFWFQLYVMKDRGITRALIERALAAKCSALMVTVDLQILGQRHFDVRNASSVSLAKRLRNLVDKASKPAWAASMARAQRKTFGNLTGLVPGMDSVTSVAAWTATQFDPSLTWDDIAWIRSLWPGKLIIKGIFDADDAKRAIKAGASAIVVSNHGGRQLDGAPSAISMLPKIASAVGDEIEIIFDSGVRTGQDVVRALALGARSCLLGRAYIYGLGAGGQTGVAKAIDLIGTELDVTMALTGVTRVQQQLLTAAACQGRYPSPNMARG
jgi:L-lactate dehydrogenase (cytochrome)